MSDVERRAALLILEQRGRLLFSVHVWRWYICVAIIEGEDEHEVVHIEQAVEA